MSTPTKSTNGYNSVGENETRGFPVIDYRDVAEHRMRRLAAIALRAKQRVEPLRQADQQGASMPSFCTGCGGSCDSPSI